ncbi:MAG: hypothetical protein ACI4N4_04210 [Candidatus Fimenecus sp.]
MGAFTFVFYIVPHFYDGEAIKADLNDYEAMYVSLEEYTHKNAVFSKETEKFETDTFEITFPAGFEFNTESGNDSMYAYKLKISDTEFASVIISDPVFTPADKDDEEYKSAMRDEKAMLALLRITLGNSAKKAYGINLNSRYSYDLLVNSLNLDDFDTDNYHQKKLFNFFGISKSMATGFLAANNAIYKIDTEEYKGFLYDRCRIDEESGKETKIFSLNAYKNDNLSFPYTILIMDNGDLLTEDDIYAIINSFKVKVRGVELNMPKI